MHSFLYCKKKEKSDFLFCQKKETRINSENIKMDEHNSKYPCMDWDAEDLPFSA